MTSHLATAHVQTEVRGGFGCITLARPQALNALNLEMVRALTTTLRQWRADASLHGVAIRGSTKHGPFGAFCAGGDIRFFHQAALAGDPALEDFFTEEYALNHLIHHYPKPCIAFMDGVVMGGGMGVAQGASHRLVTSRTKMAMPETAIGLFPDVGGGYFLSRCPGRIGEWLALTGEVIGAARALHSGLADTQVDADRLPDAWDALAGLDARRPEAIEAWLEGFRQTPDSGDAIPLATIEDCFGRDGVVGIVAALEASPTEWARHTAATLRKRSPLMLHVVLDFIRRARTMPLADDLRLERDLVRHCFFTRHLQRSGSRSETVEGIRALAVDKDQAPNWSPARIEDVTPEMVAPFFCSPWPVHAHPLAHLGND